MAKINLREHGFNASPTLVLEGELGKKDLDELNSSFLKVQKLDFDTFYLDLSSLTGILSMGLGALFYQYFSMKKSGHETIILNPSDEMQELLRISGLDSLMSIQKS